MEGRKEEWQAEINRTDKKRDRGARLLEPYCLKWSSIHRWTRCLYLEHNTHTVSKCWPHK